MKTRALLLFTVCMALVLWLATELWARERIRTARLVKTEEHDFKVSAKFGDRDVFEFRVNGTGTITVKASWTGNAPQLALILNGPSRLEFARKDGQSPLALTFAVTEQAFQKGTDWRVSIVNFSGRGSARGKIWISYLQ